MFGNWMDGWMDLHKIKKDILTILFCSKLTVTTKEAFQ